ncbi:MAG TPA: DUF805 domain-containing protein [Campylobacterales bacterium]|nr:DUF805 domain-containing protein [Campylobacterales bacterium]
MNIFKEYFLDVVTKKHFQFSGRATRSEFWYFVLFSMILSFTISFIGQMLGIFYMVSFDMPSVSETGEISNIVQNIPINILQMVFGLLMFFPSLAVGVRRLHDIGKSGWWYLIVLIPFIGILVLLAFFVMGSQEGDNYYGEYIYLD